MASALVVRLADRTKMSIKPVQILIFCVLLAISQAPVTGRSTPSVFDASGKQGYVTVGHGILCLDYLKIRDNHILNYSPDYPYAHIWLILYNPNPYANKKTVWEKDWSRTDEILRIEIPAPSSENRWSNGDETAFRNFGLYQWNQNKFDRLVFRIAVENPAKNVEIETIIWGAVAENDTYTGFNVQNADAAVIFRTANLPEYPAPPSAKINDIQFVHNTVQDSRSSLQVRLSFEADNLRTEPCRVAVYIHNADDDSPVSCIIDDLRFRTRDGYLTVQDEFTPFYDVAKFSNYALFIPYAAFPVTEEYHKYWALVHILDHDLDKLASRHSEVFELRHSK